MRRLYAEREVTHGRRLDDALRVTDERRTLPVAQGERRAIVSNVIKQKHR
jgi:hypothetical protein